MSEPAGSHTRRVGPRRLLVAAYAVFVLAAGGRSAVQLATGGPVLPHVLSAVAAAVYLGGLVLLARSRHRAALLWCGLELAGVLVVGTSTLVSPERFPEPTVWSAYGAGYGWVPLVLPVLAIVFLSRRSSLCTGRSARQVISC